MDESMAPDKDLCMRSNRHEHVYSQWQQALWCDKMLQTREPRAARGTNKAYVRRGTEKYRLMGTRGNRILQIVMVLRPYPPVFRMAAATFACWLFEV
jgi:hypothetical protein